MGDDDSDRASLGHEWNVQSGPDSHSPRGLLIDLGVVEHRIDAFAPSALEDAARLRASELELHSDETVRVGAFAVRGCDAEALASRLGQGDQYEPRVDERSKPSRDETEQRLELELPREGVSDLVQRLQMAQPSRRGLVQPRVLDRDGRLGRKQLRELLVLVREGASAFLLRQIQVPVGDATEEDRDAEEGAHRWMVGGEPDRARIVAEGREPERLGLPDQDAEDPPSSGQVADRRVSLRVDARRQEAFETGAGLIDDAERRVPGAGELRRRLDELLEEGVEGELRAQRDPCVDEDAQSVERCLLRHQPPGNRGASVDAPRRPVRGESAAAGGACGSPLTAREWQRKA